MRAPYAGVHHWHLLLSLITVYLTLLYAENLQRGIDGTLHFGTYTDERSVNLRISQPNAFGLLLLAFIMFLWLAFR